MDLKVPILLGLMLRHSEIEIRRDIVAQLVFCKQVLTPGPNVIKHFTSVIYKLS
jgi:hypothetical protein